jgi:Ca-activated chloride channel family protein
MKRMLFASLIALAACGGNATSANYGPPPSGTPGTGNVVATGGADFAAFRDALDHGQIPAPSSLDSAGFFAEHYNQLPAPTCGQNLCLSGMLSVSPDLVRGKTWTLLQLGMSSPLDPAKVQRPPLDLVVVVDRSGSMADGDKMTYALEGVDLLIDNLNPADNLTIIAFDDQIETVFGPGPVVNRAAVHAAVSEIYPRGSTNISGALDAAYTAVSSAGDETQLRRIIFLTDGLPTAGVTSAEGIVARVAAYDEAHIGLSTIGVGADVGTSLLRTLAEHGGGNFYFLEDPAAVREVFTEELKYFVAPIAYDVELAFDTGDAYTIGALYGSNLWHKTTTGARLALPSVYLASRTSDNPGENGRRGGGSAFIAELTPIATAPAGHRVAFAHLRYRLPGAQTTFTQDIPISYGAHPGECDAAGYFSHPEIDKNTQILSFFVAFRDTTALAQTSRPGALALLAAARPRLAARIFGTDDDDLTDDLRIVDEYVNLLRR